MNQDIIMLAGIICATESLLYVIKKYRTVFVFVFMMSSILSTLWFSNYTILFIDSDKSQIRNVDFYEKAYHIIPIMNIYFLAVGLIFLLVGIVLFDRYA